MTVIFASILIFALMVLGAVLAVVAFSPPVQARNWVGRVYMLGIALILVTIPLSQISSS